MLDDDDGDNLMVRDENEANAKALSPESAMGVSGHISGIRI